MMTITTNMIELRNILEKEGLELFFVENYLKIGYWKKLSNNIFEKVKHIIYEECFYDEDCGNLYVYYFKK